jgi:hypothetical protein
MSKFLKQSSRLKAWSAKFKITAGQSLDKYKLVKTGALKRSIRSILRDTPSGPVFLQYYLFYGDIQQNDYPSGHKWGRGKLRKFKKGRPWFTEAYIASQDELITAIELDIADELLDIIEP